MAANDENSIIVTLRPLDRGVSLGEQLSLSLPNSTTLQQLRRCIYELKGIPSRRQKLSFENGSEIPERMESWTLRRIGLNNHSVILVSPIRPGMWLWHPLEYYRMQVINQVLAYLEGKHCFEVELRDLEKAVPIPSMVPDSMLVLLRQYPDYIDVFPDNAQGKIFVHKATLFQHAELSSGDLGGGGRVDQEKQQREGAEGAKKKSQESTTPSVRKACHEHK